MEQIIRDFQNPPSTFRAKPFWAWNGELEEKELLRQVRILHEMGFGGFFMHSRTGLQTEYLGEKWFRLTDACAKEAEALGMEPWIYDEDRWPSGPAGGLVTKDVRFRRKYLTLSVGQPDSGGTPVAAFAARVDGLRLEPGYRAIAPDGPLEDGETRLLFCMHTMDPSPTYNSYTDADRLSLAATRRFLELTHEQYASRCERFDGLCGVFTDEPHRGMVFSDFSDPGEMRCRSIPWTDDLPEAFEAVWGQSLLPRLPELFLQLNGQRVSKLKWQYMELLQQLFITRYLMPIQQWANANGKKTTGHFLHEDCLMAQAVPTGSLMRCYEYLDEPGMDNLTENSYAPWAVKQLSSVARQLGKGNMLSELYAATGWQMTFRDYKYITDWQIMLGVNVRCPHLSWYTMQGEAKRDYPASLLHQSTWYREYAQLEAYFARFGLMASQGKPVCDTLVLHPAESLWYQIHPNWANGLEAADDCIQKLERQFRQLFDWLMQTQTDFDYGDEGLLAAHGAVEDAALRVGQMRYRRVVVCGCESIRESTASLLRAFSDAGGELVFLGAPPRYVAGEQSRACSARALKAVRLPMKKAVVLRYFRSEERPVSVLSQDAQSHLYMQLRQLEDGFFVLFWNKNRKKTLKSVKIRVPAGMYAELWDCADGQRYALPVTAGQVQLDFAPGQERILHLTTKKSTCLLQPKPVQGEPVLLAAPIGYRLDEPNVLVLDRAALWLDGKVLAQSDEILNLDRALRRALSLDLRGGEALQPWAREPSETFSAIRLRYDIQIEVLPREPVWLAMEPMAEQAVFINGRRIDLKKEEMHWIDSCFALYAIPEATWQEGENTLEVTARYSADSGLEAMYLLGQFGVFFRRGVPTVGKLPQKLRVGDLTKQGLPFYGGKVFYSFAAPQSGRFVLPYPRLGGSCAAVQSRGERTLLLWEGQWAQLHLAEGETLELEAVLNRRNTFGPLHRFPAKLPYTAPDSFTCDDAARYSLYPTGLLAAPELYRADTE